MPAYCTVCTQHNCPYISAGQMTVYHPTYSFEIKLKNKITKMNDLRCPKTSSGAMTFPQSIFIQIIQTFNKLTSSLISNQVHHCLTSMNWHTWESHCSSVASGLLSDDCFSTCEPRPWLCWAAQKCHNLSCSVQTVIADQQWHEAKGQW